MSSAADRTPAPGEPQAADVLELLLPDVGVEATARAGRVVHFLRLLSGDAASRAAELVGLDLDAARGEMERVDEERLRRVLLALLHHHLRAALPEERFLELGVAALALQEAWSELAELRRGGVPVPDFPAPGEPELQVARRLLAALRASEVAAPGPSATRGDASKKRVRPRARGSSRPSDRAEGEGRLWAARYRAVAHGPAEGEEAFRALLEWERRRGGGLVEHLAALRGVAECLLDRGAVPRALDWLERQTAAASCDEGLARLYAWALLLRGEEGAVRETVQESRPHEGRLPAPLVELRARVPRWLRWLSGRAVEANARGAPARAVHDRAEVGAAVLAVLELGPCGSVQALHADVSPGLREAFPVWLRRRDGACARPEEPEHRVVSEARPLVLHRFEAAPLRGAVAEDSLALALVPVHDGEGEVAGWLHLEWSHHLVPTAARLASFARGWSAEVLRGRRGLAAPRGAAALAGPGGAPRAEVGSDPRARAWRALVLALGTKTAQRRWWGLDVGGAPDAAAWSVCDEGGEQLADWVLRPGGARAVTRALLTQGPVLFGDPDSGLSLHAEAASGVVVPVVFRRRVHGLLVLESIRRRDFRPEDAQRIAAATAGFAVRWRAAQFRAWHRLHHGHDVFFEPSESGPGARLADLPVAGRARTGVAIVGDVGVGRGVLARWLHFESRPTAGACAVLRRDGAEDPVERARRLRSSAAEEAPLLLVVEELDRWTLAEQARLEGVLSDPPAPAAAEVRLVASLATAVLAAVEAGRLHPDLARRFERLELFVPPLRERRAEIPALAELLLARFAEEERLAPARPTDAALALLWRQPWPGNLRQLEGLLYKLTLFHPGEEVGAEELLALAARFRLELVRRLPSRRPDPTELQAALELTRKATGSINKTRAALYLGWDPDTLVARMKDAGL